MLKMMFLVGFAISTVCSASSVCIVRFDHPDLVSICDGGITREVKTHNNFVKALAEVTIMLNEFKARGYSIDGVIGKASWNWTLSKD